MERKGATHKLQKKVEYRRIIDAETGVEETIPSIFYEDRDENFQKIFLGHILSAINAMGSQKLNVLMWLLKNRNSDNIVRATHRSIAESTKCAKQTVTSVLKLLDEHEVIKQIAPGVYQVNPDVIWKGSHGKRMRILLEYERVEKPRKKSRQPEAEA